MPDPPPIVDVRVAVFLTFDQARVILEALQRLQKQGEAEAVIDDLMRQMMPFAGSVWVPESK